MIFNSNQTCQNQNILDSYDQSTRVPIPKYNLQWRTIFQKYSNEKAEEYGLNGECALKVWR